MAAKKRYVYRSARTGKFVTRRLAERNQGTTVRERVKPAKRLGRRK